MGTSIGRTMKVLYLDNRDYGHNRDLHVDFFVFAQKHQILEIYPYGRYLHKFFKNAIAPGKHPNRELKEIVEKNGIEVILTYNPNGSSYELGYDNVHFYQWCQEFLTETNLPKFHFSTDYCRDEFRQEQADWFKDLKYTAAFFRHRVSLKHPIEIPAFWIPFSVDRELYQKYSQFNIKLKNKKVGFLGAAHNSSKSLYAHRIAAMDYLKAKKQLAVSKVIRPDKFEREILLGKNYVEFLSSNLFGLTCGGTCQFMTAKYFQIPAAYSLLVCAKTDGLEIFPPNTYLTFDKNHLDDFYQEILEHEKNLKLAKKKIYELNQYVIENHHHEKRWKEIIKLIKAHI